MAGHAAPVASHLNALPLQSPPKSFILPGSTLQSLPYSYSHLMFMFTKPSGQYN